MKRKEFIDHILNNIIGGEPTGFYAVYCDKSQSSNPTKQKQMFFLRLKYPCFSSKVRINFEYYKAEILKYMKKINETNATVHLRTTHYGHSFEYNFIEIIFHNGKPWEKDLNLITNKGKDPVKDLKDLKNKSTILKLHSVRENQSKKESTVEKEQTNTVSVDKAKYADMIRFVVCNNKNSRITKEEAKRIDDDVLIKFFDSIYEPFFKNID